MLNQEFAIEALKRNRMGLGILESDSLSAVVCKKKVVLNPMQLNDMRHSYGMGLDVFAPSMVEMLAVWLLEHSPFTDVMLADGVGTLKALVREECSHAKSAADLKGVAESIYELATSNWMEYLPVIVKAKPTEPAGIFGCELYSHEATQSGKRVDKRLLKSAINLIFGTDGFGKTLAPVLHPHYCLNVLDLFDYSTLWNKAIKAGSYVPTSLRNYARARGLEYYDQKMFLVNGMVVGRAACSFSEVLLSGITNPAVRDQFSKFVALSDHRDLMVWNHNSSASDVMMMPVPVFQLASDRKMFDKRMSVESAASMLINKAKIKTV